MVCILFFLLLSLFYEYFWNNLSLLYALYALYRGFINNLRAEFMFYDFIVCLVLFCFCFASHIEVPREVVHKSP